MRVRRAGKGRKHEGQRGEGHALGESITRRIGGCGEAGAARRVRHARGEAWCGWCGVRALMAPLVRLKSTAGATLSLTAGKT